MMSCLIEFVNMLKTTLRCASLVLICDIFELALVAINFEILLKEQENKTLDVNRIFSL